MGMSNLSLIEERAKALDEERRVRLIKSQEVDVEKYLKANDITHQIHEPHKWLQQMVEQYDTPAKTDSVSYLCWPKSAENFQFRLGEVTIYAGTNGGGKSLITGQIALGLVKQNRRVCIASFEMKPKRSLERMLRQFSGENIHKPRYMDKDKYIHDIVDRLRNFSRDKLWFYDQQGTTSAAQVIAVARYTAVNR